MRRPRWTCSASKMKSPIDPANPVSSARAAKIKSEWGTGTRPGAQVGTPAKQAAVGHCDQGLDDLVGAAAGVQPGVDPSIDPQADHIEQQVAGRTGEQNRQEPQDQTRRPAGGYIHHGRIQEQENGSRPQVAG